MSEIPPYSKLNNTRADTPDKESWESWNKERERYSLPPLSFEEHTFRFNSNLSFAPLLYEHNRITEYGIFWLDNNLEKIIHYRTIFSITEEEFKTHYIFNYEKEWPCRPENIQGNCYNYPHGRIFYHDYYIIEANFKATSKIKSYLVDFFMLPDDYTIITPY